MTDITIAKIKPGMVLAEPATDLLGNALFEKNTVLDLQKIKTLKAWGVKSVAVAKTVKIDSQENETRTIRKRRKTTQILRRSSAKNNPAEHKKEAGPPAEKLNILQHMFEKHKDNQLMCEIKEIAESQLGKDDKA